MKLTCKWCKAEFDNEHGSEYPITNGLCSSCSNFSQDAGSIKAFIDLFEAPVLLLQSNPRQVRTANQKACALLMKDLSQIEGLSGGQVLDCVHAFTGAGCGIDINCKNCTTKNAVVETFATGKSFKGVSTVLDVSKNGEIQVYNLKISTERVGELALVRIEQYNKKENPYVTERRCSTGSR